jgi:hypothetical protein
MSKITFAAESGAGPSLTIFNSLYVLGWSGKDNYYLNLWSASTSNPFDPTTWNTSVVINGQSSKSTPALVEMGGVLYIAWADTDSDHYLHFIQTSDLKTFSNAVTIQQSLYSGTGPALAVFKDALYVAWSGSGYRLNIGRYSNGQLASTTTLNEHTVATPALAADDDYLYLAWTGTNEDSSDINRKTDNNLNVMRSSDGTNFGSNADLGSAATYDASIGPALTIYDGKIFIGWVETDNYALRLAYSTDHAAYFGGETIDKDNTSAHGIALCSNMVAWTGWNNELNLQDGI